MPHLTSVLGRIRLFLTTRFARGEYLGLHLAVGLAFGVIGLWIFGALTEDVVTRDRLTLFDTAVATWLRAHATPAGDRLWATVSALGSPVTIVPLTIGVALWLGSTRNWIELGAWLGGAVGGAILNEALKLFVHRPRPAVAAYSAAGYSFPSGHAMGSLISYGLLAYLVARRTQSTSVRIAAVTVAATLIIAIGLSRLVLAVHYFSDVVAGYAAGMVWLSAVISGLEVARRRER